MRDGWIGHHSNDVDDDVAAKLVIITIWEAFTAADPEKGRNPDFG